MRRIGVTLALALSLSLTCLASAAAQTRPPVKSGSKAESRAESKTPPKPEPPKPPEPPAAYEPAMLRLSEILGALSFLRDLCGESDGAGWRENMQILLDAEAAASAERKARLAGAFNHGYRGYQLTYRACTPAARAAISRYLAEGGRLSRELATRWGG